MSARREVLAEARDLIANQDHLGQNNYLDEEGCYCAVGALGHVVGVADDDLCASEVYIHASKEAIALADAGDIGAYENNFARTLGVTQFNDTHDREAILALFDAAIEAAA